MTTILFKNIKTVFNTKLYFTPNSLLNTNTVSLAFFSRNHSTNSTSVTTLENANREQFQAFPFHLVEQSPWPIVTSFALLISAVSAVLSFQGFAFGGELLLLGLLLGRLLGEIYYLLGYFCTINYKYVIICFHTN